MAIRRIHSKGDWRKEEHTATAVAITPGMLCERTSGDLVQAHSTEGGDGQTMIAMEDDLQGKTVDDAYAVSALIALCLPAKGSEVNVLLAAGENVSVGDDLVSAGDGTFIASGSVQSGVTVQKVFGKVTVATDLSGSGAVNSLVPMEVL